MGRLIPAGTGLARTSASTSSSRATEDREASYRAARLAAPKPSSPSCRTKSSRSEAARFTGELAVAAVNGRVRRVSALQPGSGAGCRNPACGARPTRAGRSPQAFLQPGGNEFYPVDWDPQQSTLAARAGTPREGRKRSLPNNSTTSGGNAATRIDAPTARAPSRGPRRACRERRRRRSRPRQGRE